MASNDKDKNVFDRRSANPCMNYQTSGPSPSWQSGQTASSAMDMVPTQSPAPNNSFFSMPSWDSCSVDKTMPFQSSTATVVSSSQGTVTLPKASESNNSNRNSTMSNGVVIREMFGRLGGSSSSSSSSSSQTLRSSGLDKMLSMGLTASKGGIFVQGGGKNPLSAHHTLAQFSSDTGFVERAARFSSFGADGHFSLTQGTTPAYSRSEVAQTFDNSAITKISRVSGIQPQKNGPNMGEIPNASTASPSMDEAGTAGIGPRTGERKAGRLSRSSTPGLGTSGNDSDEAEFSTGPEESSSSDQVTGETASKGFSGRKRKQMPKEKAMDLPSLVLSRGGIDTKSMKADELKGMKYKLAEGMKEKDDSKSKAEQSTSANTGEGSPNQAKDNVPNSDVPKEEYIHVRARRGQATNSHSLAERVRREKISERMKFLQDLVPGCSKVTGKAVMLDEIINYVQSLQRQVEFLSMKLAAVNPRLDFNVEGLLAKDILQPRSSSPTMVFAPDTHTSYPQLHQPQQGLIQVGTEGHGMVNPAEVLRRTMNAQLSCIDGYGDAISQLSNIWDDELQSVVQMGFAQNSQTTFTSQGFSGSLPTSHMKLLDFGKKKAIELCDTEGH
eukprot:Gb_39758 [translate_table: standard]